MVSYYKRDVYPLYPRMTTIEHHLHTWSDEVSYWIGIYKFTGASKDDKRVKPLLSEWREIVEIIELIGYEQEGIR